MNEFAEIKQTLSLMLEELESRIVKITSDVRHSDVPLEKDFAEQATQAENDQVLDYLGNAARKEVDLIKKAISRIDSGEYGVCEACGETINKERLKALPFTSLCVQCASRQEC